MTKYPALTSFVLAVVGFGLVLAGALTTTTALLVLGALVSAAAGAVGGLASRRRAS